MDSLSHKRCSKCGEWKDRSEFYKKKSKKDGLQNWCKACQRVSYANWEKNNRDRYNERCRLWSVLHPKEKSKSRRKHDNLHPEQRQARHRNRAVREKNAQGTITSKEWRAVLDKYGHKCLRCGRADVELTMDHVKPLSLGGTHTIDNVQPLCRLCNCSKFTKHIDYRI